MSPSLSRSAFAMIALGPLLTPGFATAQTVAPTAGPPVVPAVTPIAKPAPEDVLLSKDPQPTFTPETAELTETAAKAYLAIVEAGGWAGVPGGTKLAPGSRGAAVEALRRRLAATADLDPASIAGEDYDAAVEAAVRRFQDRHGLETTGSIGAGTLRALNVSAVERYNQLIASANRLRSIKFPFGPRYVAVNIPSATAEAVENGRVVQSYLAVVGRPENASPTEETRITSVNLNPTWTVPASIVRKEIIPHMQTDPAYLDKANIRILDATGAIVDPRTIDWATNAAASFTLRQDSGAQNSLGSIRIDMPNRDAVYMHDTPQKGLFGSVSRFASHGCVRVSRVRDLAVWLLDANSSGDGPSWTVPMIDAAVALGTRLDVKLVKPVPVAWVYLTGYVTTDGLVHFRNDIYGRDGGAPPSAADALQQAQQLLGAKASAAPVVSAPRAAAADKRA